MNEENNIQKEILRKFMYNKKLKYGEIWDKKMCSSSNFDYHLKNLVGEGILKKEEDYYVLTTKGFNLVTSIDGVEIKTKGKPLVCSFVIGYKDGRVLLNTRKKQPFLGYLNIPGGKVELGVSKIKQAEIEFLEETGFLAKDLKLKCVTEKISLEEDTNEVAHHIIGYFYICREFEGELLKDTREGDNFWIEVDKIVDYKRFVDIDPIIKHSIEGESIKHYEINRILRNGEIIKTNIKELI
ncbi:MAG: NUDIX domain-containing protein [Candidatus Woesearchaeota archaeon]|jgi:ADP-ribose pyrophosphatase YjhB (NUDIX family)/predicted transcriptional regulator|nr:NUDIX domain-containing protein [Candidatus Woesearchaeota archaeon]